MGRERLNLVLFVFSARVKRGLERVEGLRAWEERVWTPRAEDSPTTVAEDDVGLRRDCDRVRAALDVVGGAEGILFSQPMAVGRTVLLTVLLAPEVAVSKVSSS